MSEARTVSTLEFLKDFERYQSNAVSQVNVTLDGQVVGAFLSRNELAHFEMLKRRESEVLVVGNLTDDVVSQIEAAVYGQSPI